MSMSCDRSMFFLRQWYPLAEKEHLGLPLHLRSSPVLSSFWVAQSVDFCEVFCRLLFVLFSFLPFVVYFSSIYVFSFPCWYLLVIRKLVRFHDSSFGNVLLESDCVVWKKKKICPFLRQYMSIYFGHSFSWNTFDLILFKLSFSFDQGIVMQRLEQL